MNVRVLNRNFRKARPGIARFACACTLAAAGCHGSGLDLALVKSTSGKPSNVAVYFRVDRSDGKPVGGLTEKNFRIYEDNGLVSEFESKQLLAAWGVASSDEHRAMSAEAAVRVGGERAASESCADLFACFAREWYHVGPWGSGAKMKLVVNLVLGLNRAALAEGLAFARACGLPLTLA